MTEVIGELFEMSGASKDAGNTRASKIFGKLDFDGNGELDEMEFVRGCMDDQEFLKLLEGDNDDNNDDGEDQFEYDYHVPKMEDGV